MIIIILLNTHRKTEARVKRRDEMIDRWRVETTTSVCPQDSMFVGLNMLHFFNRFVIKYVPTICFPSPSVFFLELCFWDRLGGRRGVAIYSVSN